MSLRQESYLKIKVLPNSSKTEFRDILDDGTIKISLSAVPEKGRANKELIRFLCFEFGLTKECIVIISGSGSRTKLIRICN